MTTRAAHTAVAELARSYLDGEKVGRTLQQALLLRGWEEDQVDRLLSKGLREAAHQLLLTFREVAQSPEPAPENPFRTWAEVQDANVASARVYSAFATVMGSREGTVWADTERLARDARYKALKHYAARSADGTDQSLDLSWVRLAVLGVGEAPTDFRIHTFLPQLEKVIGSYALGHRRVLGIGYTWVSLESTGPGVVASLRAMIHSRVNLVLPDIVQGGVQPFREEDAPDDFTINVGPDQVLHATLGSRRGGGAIVPVAVETLRQARLEDMRPYDQRRIVEELQNKHGYVQGGPDAQKRTAFRMVAYTKDRRIKWIKPDPFAP